MTIREGYDAIRKRNEQAAKTSFRGIPELILSGDGDIAVFRFLTDSPVDVDVHEIRDDTISKRPLYYPCTRDEKDFPESGGECEHCNIQSPLTRLFYFWIWTERILHPAPAEDGSWSPVKFSNRTYYEEKREAPQLIKRKFGRGQSFWEQFQSAFDTYGTWMDRNYTLRRRGAPNDINTTYTLTSLDKTPMPKHLKELAASLPSLKDVALGKVTSLIEGEPEVTVDLPEVGD